MQLLRDRRLALLVAGQALNGIGSWCAIVALWGFASFRFDAGPGAIALLGLAWALPPLLLGPLAGVPIDRFGPKRVIMVADALAAVVSLAFLLAGSFPVLVALAALHGVTSSFSEPALRALPPRLVADDDLVQANALLGARLAVRHRLRPVARRGRDRRRSASRARSSSTRSRTSSACSC